MWPYVVRARAAQGKGAGMSRRLFVAVDVGDEVRRHVVEVIDRLRAKALDSRWVRDDGLHVTLAFLGSVEEERLPSIEQALAHAAKSRTPLMLHVAGGGTFGTKSHPRVLWVALR